MYEVLSPENFAEKYNLIFLRKTLRLSDEIKYHVFIFNSFAHIPDVINSHAVLGFLMLHAHVAYDEICFQNSAYIILILLHATVPTITVYCS